MLTSLMGQIFTEFGVIIALNGAHSWHPHLEKIRTALKARNISVDVHECIDMEFADVHQYLINQSNTEFICRVDDDHVLDPLYLQQLWKVISADPAIGAAGGIFLHPDIPGWEFTQSEFKDALYQGRREGILQTFLQLKMHPTDKPLQVPDLYSSFMMRKSAVQEVGGVATCYTATYREETDLTLRMTLAGYKQMVIPSAVAWHVRADGGGERMSERSWEEVRSANDEIFRQRVRGWCQYPVDRFTPIWEMALSNIH
jgi:GT2 family glycosyltransferase